jgi:F-box-like
MSAASISQSNILGVDVLLMIFQQLEGENLVNCEAVCHQWRDILLAGTPWRRLFHRKVESPHFWQKAQKKLEKNQQTLRTEPYRDVCGEILHLKRNWRTGCSTKFTFMYPVVGDSFVAISDEYVSWNYRFGNDKGRRRCAFLDTETMKITEMILDSRCHHFNEMLVSWDVRNTGNFTVETCDPKNNWIIDVVNEEEGFYDHEIAFGSKLLVCYSAGVNSRIRIWKLENPPTLLHDRNFGNRDLRIWEVDEQFIVANYYPPKGETFSFISTETLEEVRTLSLMNCNYRYDRGLLFQTRVKGIVRILDVITGTYYNDVRLPIRKEDERSVEFMYSMASNSIVIVIGWKYAKDRFKRVSHLSVYDLEAVKKRNSGCHLLYTLQFQCDIYNFVMNESEIATQIENHL